MNAAIITPLHSQVTTLPYPSIRRGQTYGAIGREVITMNMMKALIPSTILTLLVSALVGYGGAGRGFLNLQAGSLIGYQVFWSWTLFFVAMALNGALVLRIRSQEGTSAEPGNMA